MLKNYIKIFFRQLFKNKAYSFINIGGLAIGIAAALLIMLYVQFEQSYDADLTQSDQLYRLNLSSTSEGELMEQSARTSPAMGQLALDEIPAVEAFSRVVIMGEVIAGSGEDFIREEHIFLTDSNYFDFFDLEITQGSIEQMNLPLKAMLSENTAQKIFGNEDPSGKVLEINSTNFDGTVEFEVAGVFESVPENRHLKPQILVSYATLHHFIGKQIDQSYEWLNLYTYLKINSENKISGVENQVNEALQLRHGEALKSAGTQWNLELQAVDQIHTSTKYAGEYNAGIDGGKLKYFIWIGAFVLLMVYLNSVNITNARALNRAREIGVRKVTGGNKKQLFLQFMLESSLINLIAVSIAAFLINLSGNFIVEVLSLNLPDSAFTFNQLYLHLLVLWIFGTLISGIYPAAVLTSFSPSAVLKGTLTFKLKNTFARPLLISQLIFCLVILSGILTVYYQLNHMREQELGISLNDKLVVRSPMLFVEGSGNYQEQMNNELTKIDGVKSVAATNEIPGNEVYWRTDNVYVEGKDKSGSMYSILNVGKNYFETFKIQLQAGRYFNEELEEGSEAIINKKALETLGFEKPEDVIGEQLFSNGNAVPIVGVVENYRQQGVNNQLNPMVLNYSSGDLNYYILDINKGETERVLPKISRTFNELFPASPFEYYFLDEHFDKQYKSERQFVQLFSLAAIIAVIIAIMGIVGVTTQLIIQRNKEISIRKIMGASFADVLALVSREYLVWLSICFVVGIPLSYYLFSNWLDNFLIRIELGWWFYLIPAIIIAVIFISSTLIQTLKAAWMNPVETLKDE
ncbi:ABC transporter permease [Marivirga sp. S37H4]|uniref:ABC transporter permease n=1 Tax=Marivirga aurantiaca TaxID=2802615 RepID=A0A935CA64_9BACT|nr:ABC transporter permease [Marivirga aurantiaca]MBK6266364.1 ABC transporter permease [Marivirga aurantiaca]